VVVKTKQLPQIYDLEPAMINNSSRSLERNEAHGATVKSLLHEKENKLEFLFAHASNLNWHGVNPERKPLSVAFDLLQLLRNESR